MRWRTGPNGSRRPRWITQAESQRQFISNTPCWVCGEQLGDRQAAREYGLTGRRQGLVTPWRHADCTNSWTETGIS